MKLTLRDLFWLVLVAGLACAWWIERSRTHAMHREVELWADRAMTLQRELLYRGIEIEFDDDGGMTVIEGRWSEGS
jgi:hypothetical protein